MTQVVSGNANEYIKVTGFSFTTLSNGTNIVDTRDSTGKLLWEIILESPGGVTVGEAQSVAAPAYLFKTGLGANLNVNLSSGVPVTYSFSFFYDVNP